ncbi:hypothetical protein SEA_LITTLEFELLA_75 [Gordonia phage LittleFella]|nr:hypothetical protein SEA_LITTLEFELLA_75 [Gordonia phage LittleFella]
MECISSDKESRVRHLKEKLGPIIVHATEVKFQEGKLAVGIDKTGKVGKHVNVRIGHTSKNVGAGFVVNVPTFEYWQEADEVLVDRVVSLIIMAEEMLA